MTEEYKDSITKHKLEEVKEKCGDLQIRSTEDENRSNLFQN